jgi:hypothetical protein
MAPLIDLHRFKARRKCVTPTITVLLVSFIVLIGSLQVKNDTRQDELRVISVVQMPLLDAPSDRNSNAIDADADAHDDILDRYGSGRADVHHRKLQEDESSNRPMMYTYYEPATTDMSPEADEDLLQNWKKAWYDAGWQPMVLSEADARKVPEYKALVELVIDTKHIGSYNMACKYCIKWSHYTFFIYVYAHFLDLDSHIST